MEALGRQMNIVGGPSEFESDDDRTYMLTRLPVHTKAAQLASGEVTGD